MQFLQTVSAVFQLFASLLMLAVWAAVQEDFSPECREFLYMGTPPQGLQDSSLKKICQVYNGKERYVTLYDTVSHIPIYSAYAFQRSDGSKKVDVPWMYEPQLSTMSTSGDMQPFPPELAPGTFADTQAMLEDYSNAVGYERGQLNPDEHQARLDDKAATYTLTNVVPQAREFSSGPWREHVHTIRRRLNNYCRGAAYIVTGVTTSGSTIRGNNVDRITIPMHLWSAYCCVNYDHNAPFQERTKFPAYAAYGLNTKEEAEVLEVSLHQLEDFLKTNTFMNKAFKIFYENCVANDASMS